MEKSARNMSIVILLTCLAITAFLCFLASENPITGDDTWAATSVLGNPYEVFIFTLRWDLHPPLYYIYVDIWALLSKSDFWLRYSSGVLHSLGTTLTFMYVKRRNTTEAAVVASLLVLFSPMLLIYATKLRMYTFLAFLSICYFYLLTRYFESNQHSYLTSLFVVGLIITNSHAIGILLLFFHFLYGIFLTKKRFPSLKAWVSLHLLLVLFAIPAIANSVIKSVGHASSPSLVEAFGIFQNIIVDIPTISSLITAGIVILILFNKQQRNLIICYLLMPIILFSLISASLKPLWLARNFIFFLPIIGIATGITISQLKLPKLIKFLTIALICSANIYGSDVIRGRSSEGERAFKEVVDILSEKLIDSEKTCIVSTNHYSTFWSLQRYMNGIKWANPTNIQPPINKTWKNFANNMPQPLVSLLKLNSYPNFTESNKLIISSGESERCSSPDVDHVYVVTGKKSEEDSLLIFENNHHKIFKR